MTEPLDLSDIERLISQEMTQGREYVYGPDNISQRRDRNFDYYRGIMNDLPVPAGRSRVVDRTMFSYIGMMTPQIMRVFMSGRDIAKYVAPSSELDDVVKIATRYINDVVVKKDNRGEACFRDWFKDGAIQVLGTVKWWWEQDTETKDEILEGIPDEAFELVVMDAQAKGAEIVEHSPNQGMGHALKLRVKVNASKAKFDVIPPEEYIISRTARNDLDPTVEAHYSGQYVGDLVEQGIPFAELEGLPTWIDAYPDQSQKYGFGYISPKADPGAQVDPYLRKVGIAQGIVRCNFDGTGLKPWYFLAGGLLNALKVLDFQPYKCQVGFANFCPDPLPHTVYGSCPGDDLAEIQKVKTVITRQILDNAYLHNSPQREVVKNWIVKPDQLMNMAPGAPVLVEQPGAIREIQIPFVGPQMLELMNYFDADAEIRTGVGRNSIGLDPETLTNQSATASNNTFSAMRGRVEDLARIWRDGGMRKLFQGLLNMVIEYQDFERVIQVDGKPVTVDPRQWAALKDADVVVNTGLGTGNRDKDYMLLQGISLDQEKVMAALGPANPIVDLKKAVRTKQMMVEAAGVDYPEQFYGDPVNEDGSPWMPQPPEPQPTPDTVVLAQVEQAKIESKERTESADRDLEREKAVAEIASKERIEMAKIKANAQVELMKAGIDQAKLVVEAAKVDVAMIKADMDRAKEAA